MSMARKKGACCFCNERASYLKSYAKKWINFDPDLCARGIRTWLSKLCPKHEIEWAAELLKLEGAR